ncbi:MAG TPA: endo-1,4-beta-xylanase [Caulobacteraceae bacterium]|jgi:endo-1,4-beta-xylanase
MIARRTFLLSSLALAACGREAQGEPAAAGPVQALRAVAPFPVGCAVKSELLDDTAYAALLTRHFSQLTAEWEMKMEYILQSDGAFRFDAPDRLAGFARANGMRLFGHTLVWYEQKPDAFARIDGTGEPFARAYRNYILAVAGRYRGQIAGWDVVNEAVAEDGEGLRASLWSRNLGELDHIRRAFDHAREADPDAVLFLNDYNLEHLPKKRATFLRLAERLLGAGAPLGGLGTQTHLSVDTRPGAVTAAVRDLAKLGLPIHVSELDVKLKPAPLADTSERLQRQARLYGEVGEAFAALPERQRFALTVWGLRDRDHWLRRGGKPEEPTLFDDAGRPKPAFHALVRAFGA